jgi:hypothetical protein
MNPYYPVESCPACGNVRPWRHGCPCGDPGGMPRTLPERWPNWSKAERALYGGASIRVMGEVDRAGNLLVCFMSGPLGEAGECRWMSWVELTGNANADEMPATHAEPAQDAPDRDEPGMVSTREDATADGEINGCQVETGETAA